MITEDQLEQLCLTWFQETGYDSHIEQRAVFTVAHGDE
jgi:hypothetical protein